MSKVVLVCVKQKVSINQIHQIFSRFGQVQKILIFEKSSIYKLFVEFEQVQEALRSMSVNQSNQMKIQVFKSGLECLNFSEHNPDGRIFVNCSESTDDDDHSIKLGKQNYQWEFKQWLLKGQQLLEGFNQGSKYVEQLRQLLGYQREILDKYEQEMSQQKIQQKIIQQIQKSRVIIAQPFDENRFNIKMLYNIFSIYGNIEKMIFEKDISTLSVQYSLQKCADQALEKLNNVKFGEILRLEYSKQEQLEFKNEFQDELQHLFEERFVGGEEFNRYKAKNSYVAAAPNDTVFVMNLPDMHSMEKLVFFENGLEYKFYPDPKEKHGCGIRFRNHEEAMMFIGKYHGMMIGDRKILITFSKKAI